MHPIMGHSIFLSGNSDQVCIIEVDVEDAEGVALG